MIKEVGLQNFKIFSDKKTFRLDSLNIFAGVNGRGKSTIFQSLLMLAQSVYKNGNIDELAINGSFIHLSQFSDILCSHGSDSIIRFSLITDETFLVMLISSIFLYPLVYSWSEILFSL